MKQTINNRPKHGKTTGGRKAVGNSRGNISLKVGLLSYKTSLSKCPPTTFGRGTKEPEVPPSTHTFTKRLNKSGSALGSFLYFPSDFCSDILKQDDSVLLEDECSRKWPVKFLHRSSGHSVQGLSGGWAKFARHHQLNEGDELGMELVQSTSTPLIFKVNILRIHSESKVNSTATSVDGEEKLKPRNLEKMYPEKKDVSCINMDLECASESYVECEFEVEDEVANANDHYGSSNSQSVQKSDKHFQQSTKKSSWKKEDQDEGLQALHSLRVAYSTDSEDESPENLGTEEDDPVLSVHLIKKSETSKEEAAEKLPVLPGDERKGVQSSVHDSDEPQQILESDEDTTMIRESGTPEQEDGKLQIPTGDQKEPGGRERLNDYSDDEIECQVPETGGNVEENRTSRGSSESLQEPVTDHEYNFLDEGGNEDWAHTIMKQEMKKTMERLGIRGKNISKKRVNLSFKTYPKRASKSELTASCDFTDNHKRKGQRFKSVLRRGFKPPDSEPQLPTGSRNFHPDYPSFEKVMTRTHTTTAFLLTLPGKFCGTHLSGGRNLVDLEDERGLRWEVIYLQKWKAFSGGWRGFALDHKLKVGDTAVFTLVDHSTFKVSITSNPPASKTDHDRGS